MAGRRLKETILNLLSGTGINYLALATYANAYAGYVTTKKSMMFSIMKELQLTSDHIH